MSSPEGPLTPCSLGVWTLGMIPSASIVYRKTHLQSSAFKSSLFVKKQHETFFKTIYDTLKSNIETSELISHQSGENSVWHIAYWCDLYWTVLAAPSIQSHSDVTWQVLFTHNLPQFLHDAFPSLADCKHNWASVHFLHHSPPPPRKSLHFSTKHFLKSWTFQNIKSSENVCLYVFLLQWKDACQSVLGIYSTCFCKAVSGRDGERR